MKYVIVIIYLFAIKCLFAQDNLVPNGGFENGNPDPDCDFGLSSDGITLHLSDWIVLDHNMDYTGLSPEYIDITDPYCVSHRTKCGWYYGGSGIGNDFGIPEYPPLNRYVILKSYSGKGYNENKQKYKGKMYRNDIAVKLSQTLIAGEQYVFRIKYIPYSKKVFHETSGINHLRVFLSEVKKKWYKGTQHQLLEDQMANIVEYATFQEDCIWKLTERTITVPYYMDKLNYLILYVEDGLFGIDDVALFKKCPDPMLIENKVYDDYFYKSVNLNYPFVNEAAGVLKAGYDVGAPTDNGYVIVKNHADVTYRSATRIELLPGFSTESGARFVAEIQPCSGNRLAPADSSGNEHTVAHNPTTEDREAEPTPQGNVSGKPGLVIYPNPTGGLLTLAWSGAPPGGAEVRISNLFGQEVYSGRLAGSRTEIDLSGQAAGVYLLSVKAGDRLFRRKLALR